MDVECRGSCTEMLTTEILASCIGLTAGTHCVPFPYLFSFTKQVVADNFRHQRTCEVSSFVGFKVFWWEIDVMTSSMSLFHCRFLEILDVLQEHVQLHVLVCTLLRFFSLIHNLVLELISCMPVWFVQHKPTYIPNSWSANVSVVGRDISCTNCMQYFSLQPLGFKIDNSKLKRAGLDYWPYPPYIDISFACDLPCDWLEDSAQGFGQAVRNIYLPNRNIWKGDISISGSHNT